MGCGVSKGVHPETKQSINPFRFPIPDGELSRTSVAKCRKNSVERHSGSARLSILGSVDPRKNTLQENLVEHKVDEGDIDTRNFYTLAGDSTGSQIILGSGMSGSVRQIKRISDGKKFALKTIATDMFEDNPDALEELESEINILKTLDHPHISKLYETYDDPGVQIHLVLELCNGGELFNRLMQEGTFSEMKTAQIVYNMLKALYYIHLKNIVHRDIRL